MTIRNKIAAIENDASLDDAEKARRRQVSKILVYLEQPSTGRDG